MPDMPEEIWVTMTNDTPGQRSGRFVEMDDRFPEPNEKEDMYTLAQSSARTTGYNEGVMWTKYELECELADLAEDDWLDSWVVERLQKRLDQITPPTSPSDLHQHALKAAEARGYARAVGDAARLCADAFAEQMTMEIFEEEDSARNRESAASMAEKLLHAIRALSPTPADPVAEADSFDALVSAAKSEARRAMQKFPQPNYVISKVAEEAGEVVKAAIHCAEGRESASEVRAEMKQLIAMLYRLWTEGDGVHGLRALAQKEGE